jgi:hypothetical protein
MTKRIEAEVCAEDFDPPWTTLRKRGGLGIAASAAEELAGWVVEGDVAP